MSILTTGLGTMWKLPIFNNNMDALHETAATLTQEWGLQADEIISRETILARLAERVAVLLDRGADSFYLLMYRIDISEKKLTSILNEPDVAMEIARLIYARQQQKIESRKLYKSERPEDPDLTW